MNQADYFKNPWWDMVEDHTAKQVQMRKEQQEVWDEMILQEYLAGKHSKVIAEEWGLHFTNIHRAVNRAKYKRKKDPGLQ